MDVISHLLKADQICVGQQRRHSEYKCQKQLLTLQSHNFVKWWKEWGPNGATCFTNCRKTCGCGLLSSLLYLVRWSVHDVTTDGSSHRKALDVVLTNAWELEPEQKYKIHVKHKILMTFCLLVFCQWERGHPSWTTQTNIACCRVSLVVTCPHCDFQLARSKITKLKTEKHWTLWSPLGMADTALQLQPDAAIISRSNRSWKPLKDFLACQDDVKTSAQGQIKTFQKVNLTWFSRCKRNQWMAINWFENIERWAASKWTGMFCQQVCEQLFRICFFLQDFIWILCTSFETSILIQLFVRSVPKRSKFGLQKKNPFDCICLQKVSEWDLKAVHWVRIFGGHICHNCHGAVKILGCSLLQLCTSGWSMATGRSRQLLFRK